jgi:hypothetical protein
MALAESPGVVELLRSFSSSNHHSMLKLKQMQEQAKQAQLQKTQEAQGAQSKEPAQNGEKKARDVMQIEAQAKVRTLASSNVDVLRYYINFGYLLQKKKNAY